MKRFFFTLAVLLAVVPLAHSQQQNLTLMPWPAKITTGQGVFAVPQDLQVQIQGEREARVGAAVDRFRERLAKQTGRPIPPKDQVQSSAATLTVRCEHKGKDVQELGEDESYRLEITPTGATLDAPGPLGVIHGLQTFLQLVRVGPNGFSAPAVVIEDKPRFPWRGLLIDVSRHFMSVDDIKRNLDAMEAVKFNVLHWHLADNQGFRVESKKFRKFQELASDGRFYTQDQIRDLIEYARARGIRVVPEFDMPGHTTSWFAAYPELASAPGPYQIDREWGVFDPAMDPTKEHTYHFLDDFIGEMTKLFPDDYFHIGGDEVNGKQWDANPEIQKFMREHQLKDNAALQAYFTSEVQKLVAKHHKKMMGWDEVLQPGTPKEIVIQSWRGQESLAAAAKQGYSGLLSNGYYLDLMQPASEHYLVDPMSGAAAELSTEEKQRILGGEACMWAEMITPENLDERVWPRAAAVAERLWSPAEVRDVDSMYARLAQTNEWLQFVGIKNESNRERMLERMARSLNAERLREFLDVLEPVKEYTRSSTGKYTSSTPLNRLVDAAYPESKAGREFRDLVDKFIAAPGGDNAGSELIQQQLTAWNENARAIEPQLSQSSLLSEGLPIAKDIETATAIGLDALRYRTEQPPAGWRETQLATLQQLEQPKAELLDMLVVPVEELVAGERVKAQNATP